MRAHPSHTLCLAALLGAAPALGAADAIAAAVPGSRNTLTAEPPLVRPSTAPVVVELFRGTTFADFKPKPFSYHPPKGGPWAKVVLEADFDVTAGRQFDRTCTLWIGGANLFCGTTAEPSKGLAQTWHVERDLTDYSALLRSERSGRVNLDTVVDATYDGVLHGSARLLFYPLEAGQAAPVVPDLVLPLAAGPDGGTVMLATGASRLAQTFQLPRNIERAWLDVTVKGEAKDEFWYTDLASELASRFEANQAPPLREVEIFLDGRLAGLAPVFPLIFTGGMDPMLWRPIPGIQTLCFEPWRVDLTPFAGVLNDGAPHAIALGVRNAKNYFSATASLLLSLDPGGAAVTGAVTVNTLGAAPEAAVQDLLVDRKGEPRGTVRVDAAREFRLSGYVDTSHGRVDTEVNQAFRFRNTQTLRQGGPESFQDILQTQEVSATTRTSSKAGERLETVRTSFPLTFKVRVATAADKSTTQTADVSQILEVARSLAQDGFPLGSSLFSNTVATQSVTAFDPAGKRTGSKGTRSSQACVRAGSDGALFGCRIESVNGVVTTIQKTGR